MKQVADGVWQVNTFGAPNLINAFVVDDILIDAGTRHSRNVIMRQLQGHRINAHALTHAHPDHQGASHELCEGLGIPYWVPEGDADAAENPTLIRERQPAHPIARFYYKIFVGPGHPVARQLHEGDEVGGFKVLETPGHSAGHVVYWRESDGVLILGDVVTNFDQLTLIPGLHEPKTYMTPDPDENRRSAKRLRALEPTLVLFGHGAPLHDTRKFVDFLDRL